MRTARKLVGLWSWWSAWKGRPSWGRIRGERPVIIIEEHIFLTRVPGSSRLSRREEAPLISLLFNVSVSCKNLVVSSGKYFKIDVYILQNIFRLSFCDVIIRSDDSVTVSWYQSPIRDCCFQ